MMKFVVNNVKNGCRRGHLSDVPRLPEQVVETPMCLLYTRGGSAPYLTSDMVDMIERVPPIFHLPLTLLAQSHETIKKYGQGLAKFINAKDRILYCTLNDPTATSPKGYNNKQNVSIWTRGGRHALDPDKFIKTQEALQPDIYQVMYDGDVDKDSGVKKLKKCHDRTINFLDKCLEMHLKSEKLKQTEVLGVVIGGYNTESRKLSAVETAARPVSGFVIEGFHNGGKECDDFDISDVKDILIETMKHLPSDKPRFMHGLWRPDQVLEAVSCGIDVYDSSYAYSVTDRFGALVFDYDYKSYPKKREEIKNKDMVYEINLKDKKYFEDLTPLLDDCQCYSCLNFTKSYIHHLINTGEMLAGVLLMLHNFHHYLKFFEAIRESLDNDRFDDMCNTVKRS